MSEANPRAGRRSLGPWLRIGVGAALVYWLLFHATPDFSLLVGVWHNWGYVLAALGVAVLVQVLAAWRWGRILRGQGVTLPAMEVQKSCWVASFLNQALLGTIGGDAYRIARARRTSGAKLPVLLGSVLIERMSTLWLALALAPLVWPFVGDRLEAGVELRPWLLGILAFLAGTAALVVAAVSPGPRRVLRRVPGVAGLAQRIGGLGSFLDRLGADRSGLLWLCGVGLLVPALVVLIHILLARALYPELELDPLLFFVVIPIAIFVISLPVNPPGAVGTAEAIYQLLLGLCGVPDGAVLALLLRLVLLVQCLPGAVLWFSRRSQSPPPGASPEPEG